MWLTVMASFNKKSSKTYLLSEVRGINAIQESIAFAFLKIAAEQLIVFIFQKESLLSCFKAGGHNSNSFSAIAETSSLSWLLVLLLLLIHLVTNGPCMGLTYIHVWKKTLLPKMVYCEIPI